jgi:hypothetical protein
MYLWFSEEFAYKGYDLRVRTVFRIVFEITISHVAVFSMF